MLTAEQTQQLKSELSKPEYLRLSTFDILSKLRQPTVISNPRPRGEVQKPYSLPEIYALLTQQEKINFLGTNLPFADWAHQQLSTSNYSAQVEMLALVEALLSSVVGDKKIPLVVAELINMQSKDLLLSLIKVMEAATLVSPETAAKLTGYANATIPDPTWKATVPTGPSFADSIGAPMLTLEDIEQVIGTGIRRPASQRMPVPG